MRMQFWLVCGSLIGATLCAQQTPTNSPAPNTPVNPSDAPAAAPAGTAATNAAAPAPAPAVLETKPPSAAKKSAAKAAPAKKAHYELRTIPLVPGAAVVVASNVNVRGQASLKGEVVGRITKGQPVNVLEEITKNTGPEEPSAWAKISLPENISAWVHSQYIDPAAKTVKPRRLNLRGGPGENYSVLGRVERGTVVKELRRQGEWIAIEPPQGTYGYVAAQYLKQEPGGIGKPGELAAATDLKTATNEAPVVVANEPPTTTTKVADGPEVVMPPVDAQPGATASAAPAVVVPGATNTPGESLTATNDVAIEPVSEEPPPPRIVQREGVVRGTLSIQAPTRFELYSPETGRTINYLYTSARDLDLRRYKGLRIIVTGEEGLDERWRNTPVLTIQRIQVVD